MSESNSKFQAMFKDLVWDNAVEALRVIIFTRAPYLNFWPVKQIISAILTSFSDKLYSSIVLVADISLIKFKNEQHKRQFEAESIRLAVIAQNKGIDSQEFKDARQAAKIALSRFTRFDI